MKVVVLGAGESGVGAALLAQKLNYDVLVSDAGEISEASRDEMKNKSISFEEKGHTIEILTRKDLAIKSPGIPPDAEIIQELTSAGVEVIGEIEFAFRHCEGRILAITGSNGKTTTSGLCHRILLAGGISSALCGNVGIGFSRTVASGIDYDWYVVEVSSFQLEDVKRFHPEIAMILNITPDHLDRYGGDFDLYATTKFRIAANMGRDNLLICNGEMESVTGRLGELSDRLDVVEISSSTPLEFDVGEWCQGAHNAFNASCAIAAAKWIEVDDASIARALLEFRKPPHRTEVVASIDGVTYVNDSKATNVEATYHALEGEARDMIWIAGGQDKGNDYSMLLPVVRERVSALICLGIDNEKLKSAFSAEVETIKETTDVVEAVKLAASIAQEGQVVILSPACASFDLFKNYMERGDLFKEAVLNLNKA